MATTAKCLYRQASSIPHRTQRFSYRRWHALQSTQQIASRCFSSTPHRLADGQNESAEEFIAPYYNEEFYKLLDRNDKASYRTMTPSDRKRMEDVKRALDDEFSQGTRTDQDLAGMADFMAREVEDTFPEPPAERQPFNNGFFQMGEREDIGMDDEFKEDDITSLAHAELEQHREMREYLRLASWEMPLLANLAIPFTPPTASTPLRFRYTTYMGEPHPASRKVVVEFTPSDLQLTPEQINKLIKLAGPRYDPQREIIKMSCESFETQAQNKRYLGDTINALIVEAKDPKDTFADVPFDFRHVKRRTQITFPKSWRLTEERKAELEDRRRVAEVEEGERKEAGRLISGIEAIEEGRKLSDLRRMEAPIMAEATAGLPRGKMGKKQMGQKGR